jgi:hypothetical protein
VLPLAQLPHPRRGAPHLDILHPAPDDRPHGGGAAAATAVSAAASGAASAASAAAAVAAAAATAAAAGDNAEAPARAGCEGEGAAQRLVARARVAGGRGQVGGCQLAEGLRVVQAPEVWALSQPKR